MLLSSPTFGSIPLSGFIVAPMFRKQLNDQFLLGARNQAFTTEYVGGSGRVAAQRRGTHRRTPRGCIETIKGVSLSCPF